MFRKVELIQSWYSLENRHRDLMQFIFRYEILITADRQLNRLDQNDRGVGKGGIRVGTKSSCTFIHLKKNEKIIYIAANSASVILKIVVNDFSGRHSKPFATCSI